MIASRKRKELSAEDRDRDNSRNWIAKRQAPSFPALPFQTCTIYRVHCEGLGEHENHENVSYFEDLPRLFTGDSKASALRGRERIADLSDFVESRSEIGLILYRDYSCESYHKLIEPYFRALEKPDVVSRSMRPYFYRLDEDGIAGHSDEEAMLVVSEEIKAALMKLTGLDYDTISDLEDATEMRELVTQMYHHRGIREGSHFAERLGEHLEFAIGLVNFIEETFSDEYEEADALFAAGMVNKFHLPKLLGPDTVLVTQEQGHYHAYTLENFQAHNRRVLCWAWKFNGRFWKYRSTIYVKWPSTLREIAITELSIYPIRYATPDIQDLLKQRGCQLWSVRHGKYVSYSPNGTPSGIQSIQPRYMVDMATYRELHDDKDSTDDREYLSDELMESENPPGGDFILLLPASVHGFGFQDKKWRLLSVSQIRPIKWNEQAFEHLVLNMTKKKLIRALVKKHDSTNESKDVIEGKGNGLIFLLHGGPGTGKTLTAESVAEVTHRPLYRVTCGDVGTNAEDVEEYLESVLHLGKIWRCVVLLDEADVFLEERTHQDLQRNALVSVFLRVIEYYDGVLVLTSNRIGTFDEAFKSRVQLIVHYPRLGKEERRRVWLKFITSLRDHTVNANVDELKEFTGELSNHELNGREIRNAVQTATLLAEDEEEQLQYEHLKKVISVSEEFKQYLRDRFGHDDEELVQHRGTR